MTDHQVPATSRRAFLMSAGVAATSALTATSAGEPQEEPDQDATQVTDVPEAGNDLGIDRATIAEAEKLAAVEFTRNERDQIVGTIAEDVDRYRKRRSIELSNDTAPATVFNPVLPGMKLPADALLVRSAGDPGPLPTDERDIAFAPVTTLSRWVERGQISSRRLTELYLDRLRRLGPRLECVVTLTEQRATEQARDADRQIAAGRYRGPLHGIPWGAKDLFDTKGIRTTWGAKPYRNRVATRDAAVVERLDAAGAVLVAKLTLGAIAYGDIWFDGRTNNPWNPQQGSSGSSAGPAAATAAALVGFSLGTETLGSIVSPCMRCGTTGLRPTFGRVPRTGAMALCWSLDKIGPICRTVEDCGLVLAAINGRDPGDASSLDVPLRFDAARPARGLRVGYAPKWFEGKQAGDLDRRALGAARESGLELVEVELPDWPYGTLMTILSAEAASAFEELTLNGLDDELVWQEPQAWPNSFRQTRFTPAIEYVQAQRFRRQVMEMMAERFESMDAMISPSFAGSMLLITNSTGHPSLTVRCGFKDDGTPHGITLWGRLFDEGTLCRIGMAMETQLGVWDRRPGVS